MRTRAAIMVSVLAGTISPLSAQSEVKYVGGTLATLKAGQQGDIHLSDDHYLAYYGRQDQMLRIPYDQINLLEYGQQVDRRLAMALLISPIFLLSKARKHYLTIGYVDRQGEQQALVFQVDKKQIRATLVGLEARTGLAIQYQDQEARKASAH